MGSSFGNKVKNFFHRPPDFSQICLGTHHDFFVDSPVDHLLEEALEKRKEPPYLLKYKINFSISSNVDIEKLKAYIIRDYRVYFPRHLRNGISVSFSDDLKTYEVMFKYNLK